MRMPSGGAIEPREVRSFALRRMAKLGAARPYSMPRVADDVFGRGQAHCS